MEFSISVDVATPPERVWDVMSDVERWREWTPTVTSVERLEPGPFAVGSTARLRQPRLRPAVWRVTRFESPRGFTWEMHAPGVVVAARHDVEPVPGGARATLSVKFTGLLGPLVGRLTRSLNTRYLALEAEGLRRRSESPGWTHDSARTA